MTALDGIERFETSGLWRADGAAARRNVYVSIGEAELVVQDREGTALSHWSLPALVRLNPRVMPARYAPNAGADEELEIDEPEMVAALDRLVAAVEKGRRRPGSLRRLLTGLVLGFAVGLLVMWLPGALRRQAEAIIPASQRAEIGARMLGRMTALTGPPCGTLTGSEALARLKTRLLPATPADLVILRDLPQPALALPGGLIVVSDAVLVEQDDPNVAAGHILSAALAARAEPPLARFLDEAGFFRIASLMARGDVPGSTIDRHVDKLLANGHSRLPDDTLRSGFDAARLAWTPWAEAVGLPPGETLPSDMPPALDDTSWQALREICSG
ncbi:hypothetical protein [Jannaschia rubra]|uniref:Uncharacterized protein n=1 Tax=Jannaschia rubra TaxID=282197 RepID=A0A0M6XQG6_9RHOB|nr:hypothetical protein [Jannaschia rubra]CTQ32922.1 hypothetical protein JAN5088_01696 [Jannaschia rubra]SFG27517.1 hypothetical protein SAMN04488517_103422 [Jannaschia rubra]